MSAKHTPGPWDLMAATTQRFNGSYALNICATYEPRFPVALAVGLRPEIAEANAALISAAPDMLTALMEAKDQMERLFNDHNICATYYDRIKIAIIEDAIAKATGGAS